MRRHRYEFSFSIDRGEGRPRADELCARGCILDHVVERDTSRPCFGERCSHPDPITVSRRGVLTQRCVNHRERDALPLDVGVRRSKLPNEVGPTHFTPDEIIRVIHHLHLVGLGVPHEKLDLARWGSPRRIWHGRKIRERGSHRRFVVLPARGYNSRVLKSPCYVISDAHLGVASLDIERSLVAFLRGLAGKAGSLLINGDLFDFWFEWKTVIPRNSFRALAALADLRESGVPILWIAGNHDC